MMAAHDLESRPGGDSVRLPVWVLIVVHVLFFLSGAVGLVYEVVWMRMLSLVFGNTTYAVSVVLGVFLGGLAIGALVYGRVAERRRDLLRLYGMLEVAAGLIALLLPMLLLNVLDPIYGWTYRVAGESILALTLVRVILSGGLLLAPCIFLGGTLPLLCRFLVRREEGMEAVIGRLYGLNTLGAVLGGFAAGFLLVPFLGLRLSSVAAASLGLSVGLAALLVHRVLGEHRAAAERQPLSRPAREAPSTELPGKWLLLAFALSGFAALAYEVLWMRLLVFFFENTVYAFSAMLCIFLLGLGVGSLAYSLLFSRSSWQVGWFVVLEVLIGVSGAASLAVFMWIPKVRLLQYQAGFWAEVARILLAAGLVMLLPTVLIGAVFPLVSGIWARARGGVGRGVGEVYVVNTLGTVAGAVATGFVLIPLLGTPSSLFLAAGLNICAGLLVWGRLRGARLPVVKLVAAASVPLLMVLVLGQMVSGADMVRAVRNLPGGRIEWVREGIDGTVTIERMLPVDEALAGPGEPRVLAVNGIRVAGTPFELQTTQRLQAHLAMLIHPHPKTVLHIGFGSGGTAYSLIQHPIERIDAVEICRAVVEAAPMMPETNRGVLSDPRLHLFTEDARTFVRHTPRRYDLILSDLAHPTLAGQGFFYSVDYLQDCRDRLAPGGFFSTWAPLHGLRLEDMKVLIRSIQAVFPYVYIWHSAGGRNQFCVVHGMMEPLTISYRSFADRLSIPGVAEDLAWVGLRAPEEVLALLLYDHEAVTRWVADGEQLNTDDNGYLEFAAVRERARVPAPRRMHFLSVYPDFVASAGCWVGDYVAQPPQPTAAWRQELEQQVRANLHVLRGRAYELARTDRYHLLAAMEYRRALDIAPGDFQARAMLGITERQLEWTFREATAEEATARDRDRWLGALIAVGRVEEAAEWTEEFRRRWPLELEGTSVVIAVLRERPENARRLLSETTWGMDDAGAPIRAMAQQAIALQEQVSRRPGEAGLRLELGDAYADMALNTADAVFRPWWTTQQEHLGWLRSFILQAVAALGQMAVESYEEAVLLSGGDPTATYRLACILSAMGSNQEAAELLESLSEPPLDRAGKPIRMASVWSESRRLREQERHPFAPLEDFRKELLDAAGRRGE